ncbi:MAG: RES family NAD+ phosphorylase, partial [Pseudomonadota bacterium]
MIVYRICRRKWADLSGEGARRHGGRWNSPGRPAVYLSEHPALALLEIMVHLDLPLEFLPEDFVLLSVVIPDTISTTGVDHENPPADEDRYGD